MAIEGRSDAKKGGRIRLGMVGGGEGAFIGAVHRIASRIDDHYELVAGALSSTPEKARRGPRQRPRASSKDRFVFCVTHSSRPMINALWPAIMAWRGRALVRRRRDGEVQIIRTESVLMPSGYCSVSAMRLLPDSPGLCDGRRAP